jgi:hypothetical protein
MHEVQGDDGWWMNHHHLTSTHSHTLPLYLAPPRLDPPHTHTHPWWGQVSPQPKEEERGGDKGEKLPSSVLPSSYPHSLLFIVLGQLREKSWAPPECDDEPTRSSHMEGQDEPTERRFGRPVGSADPWVGSTTLCFLQVVVRWVLKAVPGAHVCGLDA